MVRYTLETCVFLYDVYVKKGSPRKCRRKFRDERVTSIQTIHNLVNERRSTAHLMDMKQKYKSQVLIGI
jgi:hypothetical protein